MSKDSGLHACEVYLKALKEFTKEDARENADAREKIESLKQEHQSLRLALLTELVSLNLYCIKTPNFDTEARPIYINRRTYTTSRAVSAKIVGETLSTMNTDLPFDRWTRSSADQLVAMFTAKVKQHCETKSEYLIIESAPLPKADAVSPQKLSRTGQGVLSELLRIHDLRRTRERELKEREDRHSKDPSAKITVLRGALRDAENRLMALAATPEIDLASSGRRVGEVTVKVKDSVRRAKMTPKLASTISTNVFNRVGTDFPTLESLHAALLEAFNRERQRTASVRPTVRVLKARS